jgi:hydrogenase nickel incorporation protein HypA/HybF
VHEVALCENVLKILAEQAAVQDFSRVKTVWLEIGELSCAEPEAMRFCFEAVTRGTLADSARLEIIRTPGRAWCMACSETVRVGARFDPCPRCGGQQLQVTTGGEMRVKELEVV